MFANATAILAQSVFANAPVIVAQSVSANALATLVQSVHANALVILMQSVFADASVILAQPLAKGVLRCQHESFHEFTPSPKSNAFIVDHIRTLASKSKAPKSKALGFSPQ